MGRGVDGGDKGRTEVQRGGMGRHRGVKGKGCT